MARIGFIGLGNMGGPMLANLLKAGHQVTGFDLVPAARARAERAGAAIAADAIAALHGAEVAITMLPAGTQVRQVYLGPSGLIATAAPGTLLVDCSTIDVECARMVAGAARERALAMLDAPVSGGVAGAEAATLTFMVGGPAEAFALAEPILRCMGKAVIHAGDAGSGQAAKICNNLMLGIQMISVAEAFALAEKLGLDAQKLFDISSKSSGQCWSLTSSCPEPGLVPGAPSNRGFKPGFSADLMLKDLRLAQQAAQTAGVASPLGAAAAALFTLFSNAGHGAMDFSGIITMIKGKA